MMVPVETCKLAQLPTDCAGTRTPDDRDVFPPAGKFPQWQEPGLLSSRASIERLSDH